MSKAPLASKLRAAIAQGRDGLPTPGPAPEPAELPAAAPVHLPAQAGVQDLAELVAEARASIEEALNCPGIPESATGKHLAAVSITLAAMVQITSRWEALAAEASGMAPEDRAALAEKIIEGVKSRQDPAALGKAAEEGASRGARLAMMGLEQGKRLDPVTLAAGGALVVLGALVGYLFR